MNFDPELHDQPVGKSSNRNAIRYMHGAAENRLFHTAQMEMISMQAKHKWAGKE